MLAHVKISQNPQIEAQWLTFCAKIFRRMMGGQKIDQGKGWFCCCCFLSCGQGSGQGLTVHSKLLCWVLYPGHGTTWTHTLTKRDQLLLFKTEGPTVLVSSVLTPTDTCWVLQLRDLFLWQVCDSISQQHPALHPYTTDSFLPWKVKTNVSACVIHL